MEESFFKYNDKLYIVCYIDNQINIYSLNEKKYVAIDNKEFEMIKSLLNKKYSYVYASERLVSLLKENEKIEQKDYLYDFLSWLENAIPTDCRDNLYRNISTLSTELNFNYDGVAENSDEHNTAGGYNTLNNTLIIPQSSLGELRKIANMTSNPNEFYWLNYSQALLHELAHMASSNYNPDTFISLCGFDTYPSQNIEEQNRGLTEGFTEVISMAGVPGTVEIASGYYIEASLINLLTVVIGTEEITKAYFSNLGIEPIKLKLQELIPDPDKSFQLFRNIELNYQIKDLNEEQNILGNIQSTMIDYAQIKLENMHELGEYDNIKKLITTYDNFLITPEKLKMMNKNPDNYIGLSAGIDRFEQIKKEYTGELYENDFSK